MYHALHYPIFVYVLYLFLYTLEYILINTFNMWQVLIIPAKCNILFSSKVFKKKLHTWVLLIKSPWQILCLYVHLYWTTFVDTSKNLPTRHFNLNWIFILKVILYRRLQNYLLLEIQRLNLQWNVSSFYFLFTPCFTYIAHTLLPL